jgi:protein-S-isoprenylcysteine O-methyltransferase Ste14
MLIRILIALSYLFVSSELILTIVKRSRQKSVKKKNDGGSLIIIWVIITISIFAGFNLAKYKQWSIINYLVYGTGILIFIIGMIIRWASIFQLKKAFTVDVAINKDHDLKTDGLYRFVRHPSYLGVMLIVSGLSVGMNTLWSFLVITLPVFIAILYRIKVEETVLSEEFGKKYQDYCAGTKKILPYIY